MIGRLKGRVVESTADGALILDVRDIGYIIYTTAETAKKIKKQKEIALFTHLAVREDSLALYGFFSRKELSFFELLIAISGIGPKSALGILSLADVQTLQTAISANDASYLTSVSGIGRKSAERIITELKDKLGSIETIESGALKEDIDVIEALKALGYGMRESREALKKVSKKIVGTNERLRETIKILGNGA